MPNVSSAHGGVEQHVKNISERLAKNHDVSVFTTDPSGKLSKEETIEGARDHPCTGGVETHVKNISERLAKKYVHGSLYTIREGTRMSNIVKTAVVLAGGAGSRLYPLTNDRPKPMVELLGKPILQWVIEWLRHNGISEIVLGVAYHKEAVVDYFKDGSSLRVKIKYSVHSVDGETGEGFRLAISRHVTDDLFVAVNGDEITNFNLGGLISYHIKNDPVATIAVAHPRSPFGVINADEDGLVSSFVEKPLISSLLVSSGVYSFSSRIMDYLPEKGPIEKIVFPLLAREKLLRAYAIDGIWLTINTMKDLKLAERTLEERLEEGTWLE